VGPGGCRESDITLAVAKKLKEVLEAAGYSVVMTRTADDPETDSLSYRVDLANASGADIFLSIHCNSFVRPEAGGTETWYCCGSAAGRRLAGEIQQAMVASLGLADRGLHNTAERTLYVLIYTVMPAALVELAFISNPDEEVLLADPVWQERAAQALGQGIERYFLASGTGPDSPQAELSGPA